jgi:signal peptide peptidase-like protein 2B
MGGSYYFAPMVVAYAVGLLMANVAVHVMNMGQPALLYLVPWKGPMNQVCSS